jgi:hypothetical protein
VACARLEQRALDRVLLERERWALVRRRGSRAAVEFWVTMLNGGAEVTLAGILFLRFDANGLCEELREAWHFTDGRLDPPAAWGS